jgi:hypothetical protein
VTLNADHPGVPALTQLLEPVVPVDLPGTGFAAPGQVRHLHVSDDVGDLPEDITCVFAFGDGGHHANAR